MTEENEVFYIQKADEYQAWATKTIAGDYLAISNRFCDLYYKGADSFPREKIIDLFHAQIGITTEAGEFADPIKKHIMYGKPLDEENMCEELGDLLWYIAIAAEAMETTLSELMTNNIKKLAKRYPDRVFTENDAIERKDKKGISSEGINAILGNSDTIDMKSRFVKCSQCGGNNFSIDHTKHPVEITCKDCGDVF